MGLTAAAAMIAVLAGGCSSATSPAAPADTASVSRVADRSNAPRPTVVLVHGAWADTSSWDGVTEALVDKGYDVRAIANPLENLTTDAEYVADFLDTLTGPIVLVGHSYGGAVITNAAAGNRHVKALVYVDAAAPAVGEANGSLSGAYVGTQQPAAGPALRQGRVPRSSPGCCRSLPEEEDLRARTSRTTSLGRSPRGSGPLSGARPPRRSRRRRGTPPGRRSRRGTSSAAATRSSRPPRRRPWPAGHTRTSRSSRGART